jgi:hypothetical protein
MLISAREIQMSVKNTTYRIIHDNSIGAELDSVEVVVEDDCDCDTPLALALRKYASSGACFDEGDVIRFVRET